MDGLGGDAMFDAAIDSGPFTCANDSAFEPNDSIATAFATPVDTNPMISLAGLAICPVTDKDHYRVTLSGTKALEVIASWTGGTAVTLSILNAGGTSLGNGTAMGTNATRACLPNLPIGTYYALVAANAQNNYSLSIKALASCN